MTRHTLSLLLFIWKQKALTLSSILFVDTKSAHIVIVIVYEYKKRSHAKTIRLDSGTCLGPTQRPEEQGQQLREKTL